MKKILLTITAAVITGNVSLGHTVQQTLNENNIDAIIQDNGLFFNDEATFTPGYEVHAGSGNHCIYTASFWFAGLDVNGGLKLAAPMYNANGPDLWPYTVTRQDPSEGNSTPGIHDYFGQTIWTVTQAQIDTHIVNYQNANYTMPHNIEFWPAHGDSTIGSNMGMLPYLAPFVDVNNNGVYEPEQGEYPCIKGDRAVYLIMTDAAGIHGSGGETVGMEQHYMFYQYSTVSGLEDVTFVDVEVVNMGTQTLYDTRAGFFMDTDIGDYNDDYIGTDVARNMVYSYNSGADTEYGNAAPAIGMVFLSDGLDFSYGFSKSVANPQTAGEMYQVMSGNFPNGQDQMDDLGSPTDYSYTGDPNLVGSWSEFQVPNPPGDRRIVGTSDVGTFVPHFTIGAASRLQLSYAIVPGLGGTSEESVIEFQSNAEFVQLFYDGLSTNCFDLTVAEIQEASSIELEIAPNPNQGKFEVNIGTENIGGYVSIYDASGRLMYRSLVTEKTIQINAELETGVYYLNYSSGVTSGTKKFAVN